MFSLVETTVCFARLLIHDLVVSCLCRSAHLSFILLERTSLFAAEEITVMMAAFQCEDLREDRREVFEGSTLSLLGSSTYFTPTQTNFAPDAELPASTSTVPSSVYSSTRIQQQISERSDYVGSDAGYFEGEASRDFWSEFYSEPAMDQRGVDEINQEVDDDQMGRPVMESRKRHKGLLGGVTGSTLT